MSVCHQDLVSKIAQRSANYISIVRDVHLLADDFLGSGKFNHIKYIRLDALYNRAIGESVYNLGLDKFPNLEGLFLESFKYESAFSFTDLPKFPFERLREISLSSTKFNFSYLIDLMSRSKNLEQLELERCENIGDINFDGLDFDLKMMKDFRIGSSNIDHVSFAALINKMPNLENFRLGFCPELQDLSFDSLNHSLENLREIFIGNRYFDVAGLLRKAPNIEKISLCDMRGERYIVFNDLPSDFLSLKSLYVLESFISHISLVHIARNAPNLEELEILSCPSVRDFNLDNAMHDFDKLRSVEMRGMPLGIVSFRSIISKSPNIEYLGFESCRNLNLFTLDNIEINFPHLKSINLNGSDFTLNSLKYLLTKTPNLKNLYLDRNDDAKECDFDDPAIDLPKLIRFQLYSAHISANSFKSLIKKIPNIEHLNMQCCRNLGETDFGDPAFQLNNLKVIWLDFLEVTPASVKDLIDKSPNLQEIRLHGCSKLDEDVRKMDPAKLREYFGITPRSAIPLSQGQDLSVSASHS